MLAELEKLKVGIVGAVGRGGSFREAFLANGATIHAVCDTNTERLDDCRQELGACEQYTDYGEMLERAELDAVVIGTPMPLHVPQSLMALERNLHVLCEVPAGISIEECRQLVLACEQSKAIFMMAENYTYLKHNVLIRELVRQGLFGEVYYAEGEYVHELKENNETTPWRRTWQTGIEGVTYGTHSLGPILQWMPGDRVVRVCCEGSGHHYTDPRGDAYQQDSQVMLCKTAKGALIKIRVDMLSDRPHAMTNYQLQGTHGAYESHRGGPGDQHKIWCRALSNEVRWCDLDALATIDQLAAKYLPDAWRNPPPAALRAGHGGGDYFEVADFLQAITGNAPSPIGIHEAMDMTLPGLVSQQSMQQGGAWLPVPNSRDWRVGAPEGQLRMRWPASLLASLLPVNLPDGYQLRCYASTDEADYITLMDKAGFTGWTSTSIEDMQRVLLPGGFFLIEHTASGTLVATAMATHKPIQGYPNGAELGWVAADPAHAGKGLGFAVCAAVINRFQRAGYRDIYLWTDDARLPALKTYLKMGFMPDIYRASHEARWHDVMEKLGG